MPKKASDVFNEKDYVFGSKGNFKDAFPEVQEMSIHVIELESLIWMKEQTTHYLTAKYPGGEYIDCTNPSCDGGGFSMGNVLREAVNSKEKEIVKSITCQGSETTGRRCMHVFKVSGSVKYRA
ncbi:hypothetical protein ACT3UJ_16780 [Halomonas sp. 86]|uniref:hypothetical protein n=1 Tax=unclassified Halomonas TaxID=2609666 RepID=UPI004033D89A